MQKSPFQIVFILAFLGFFVACSKDNLVDTDELESDSTKSALLGATRGIWWWSSSTSGYGIDKVLGNAALENTVISDFTKLQVKNIYASYGTKVDNKPAVVAAWNKKTQLAGMNSILLLSENTWIYPNVRPGLLALVTKRIINFNTSRTDSTERMDGLHLDIEPHALPEWSTDTPEQKKALLFLLRDTFADIRALLNANGMQNFPICADLPDWYDNVGGSIGWTSEAERNQWFADMGSSLSGISFMAYEKYKLSTILSTTSWERANFSGTEEVGLNFKDSGWKKNLTTVISMLGQLETNGAVTAIHCYGDIKPYLK